MRKKINFFCKNRLTNHTDCAILCAQVQEVALMNKEFIFGSDTFCFTYEESVDIRFSKESEHNNVTLYRIGFEWEKGINPKQISLSYEIPDVDMYTMWDPIDPLRNIHFGGKTTVSRLACGMPVKGFVSHQNENAYLISVSDVKTPLSLKMKSDCMRGTIHVGVDFFTMLTGPFKQYEAFIRIDRRKIQFHQAVYDTVKWFESFGYRNEYVPELATYPMYSTWYSYMQNITEEAVLSECRKAAAFGMKTVIVDDGWQTDNTKSVYGHCGDWKPVPNKFPDMKAFADKIHALGMKVMVWYSVPFIGKYAENYAEFEGMYLRYADNLNCAILDPRYKKVRQFLINTYTKAVLQWGLDGLKLDFIDRFQTNGTLTEEMDIVSVEDAVQQLLAEISTALKQIKPDILIEFRQPYFGPVVNTYANMMRVWDCPLDPATNKTQTVNLRLVSGNCAVHSDMMYWHREERPENVALQLYGTMFAVPQISARMDEITEEQKIVLKHYLDFWISHRETLTKGKLSVTFCENGYGSVETVYQKERMVMLSATNVLNIGNVSLTSYVINLTGCREVLIRNPEEKKLCCSVYDCMGNMLCKDCMTEKVLDQISVPPAGTLVVSQL